MHLLRVAGLFFLPALLHAGFLNIQLSATCDTVTVTNSSGSITCGPVAPEGGSAHAEADFSGTGADVVAFAFATFDFSERFSATASIQAAYQITFSGPEGPGYMEVTICSTHDSLGSVSASLITPNGSVNWSASAACSPPGDIPIVFGVPLDLQLSLLADSGTVHCCGVGAEGGASASFSYQALDAARNPVSATPEVVVPEPSTSRLWMVGVWLFLLADTRAGSRHRRPSAGACLQQLRAALRPSLYTRSQPG